MSSNRFCGYAILFIIVFYVLAAAFDERGEKELWESQQKAAKAFCGNADYDLVSSDGISSVRCIRRKALNASKVKP
jgi:hypothetical protein